MSSSVAAKDLRDMQTFGKQDPYLKLKIGSDKHRTPVHEDGNRIALWNTEFIFRGVNSSSILVSRANDVACEYPLFVFIIRMNRR